MSGSPSRRPPGARPPRRPLAWLILAVCVVSTLLTIVGLRQPPRASGAVIRPASTVRPHPESPPPPVEPLIVRDLTPDDARAINAAVPLVAGAVPPAPRFAFAGPPAERERALTCLASAVWYEAGNDPVGQQAVAQVVLNRVRHPAYPKSVCGVVFQGAERKTGCQFTFTCDGALQRHPAPDAWKLARGVAGKALDGFVFKPVGTATHYHTDWVVPYWSETLDKIAKVHTHLFFRWRGMWGTPAALRRNYQGPELLDPRIAYLADPALLPAMATGAEGIAAGPVTAGIDPLSGQRDVLYIPGLATLALRGAIVRLMDDAKGEYGLDLDPDAFPGSYALIGLAICKTKSACTVAGWTKAERIPTALPLTPSVLRTVSFLYRKTASGREDAYWNCRQYPRDNPAQCLPGTEPAQKPATPAAPAPSAPTP